MRRELLTSTGQLQPLTSDDFDMLELFVTHAHEVLSRDVIKKMLKGQSWSPHDRTIDMQIRRLRQKIERDPRLPRIIKSIRGVGYVFTAAVRPVVGDEPPGPATRSDDGVDGEPQASPHLRAVTRPVTGPGAARVYSRV